MYNEEMSFSYAPARHASGVFLLVTLSMGLATCNNHCNPSKKALKPLIAIAHAGGEIHGETYTNSLEALNNSYAKGCRFFEIDFSWTSDDKLVAIHDWGYAWPRLFNQTGIPTLEEFLATKMLHGLTQLSFEQLDAWLEKHPEAFIVTDIKAHNLKGLAHIAKTSRVKHRYIPQVYHASEIDEAYRLSFQHLIWTLYVSGADDAAVLEVARKTRLFAITMPKERARKTTLAAQLQSMGMFTYAHTLNTMEEWQEMQSLGILGIYTDKLTHLK
jgi:glycerophosphoryl diester phosphodiesterase